MKVRSLIKIALLVVVAVLWGTASVNAQVVGGGLLLNGSFEGQFASLSGFPNASVAPSWLPWWVGHRSDEAAWSNQRPQFEATTTRIRSGATAQRYFTEFGTHQAGVLQRVGGVRQGDVVQFQVWARTWSSNLDHACCSLESGLVTLRAGIDPTGGGNPYGRSVVWSNLVLSDDAWTQLSVTARAEGDSVTVFVFSSPKYPVRHNEVYLDDARLVLVGHQPVVTPTVDPVVTEAPTQPSVEETPTVEESVTPDETETMTPTEEGEDETALGETPEPSVTPEPTVNPYPVSEPFAPGDDIVNGPLIYSVQPGDTLGSIAAEFDVDVADLAEANGLSEDDPIYVGGQLIVNGLTFVAPETVARYTIQPGDTLNELAFAFDTTVHMLAQLNGIVNYQQLEVGTQILVPVEAGTGALSGGLTAHVVQPDDSLTRIGLRYDVPPQVVASANRLDGGTTLHPGQVLVIP
jgi:LysM repeat protein